MLELESGNSIVIEAACSASLEAARNWKRNLAAVAPPIAQINPQTEFIFARDGSLTALENGKWWCGCSVPQKAAEELLHTLNITSPVACFLCPTHPAQIAFALGRLKPQQAVIVLLPRFDDLLLTLHCHDFSADLNAHRLWFIAGEDWPRQLAQLFEQNPGLPLPQQFIRTALLHEDASAPLIATAQKIFSDELTRRGALLSGLRESRASLKKNQITLAANLRFRLWDDAGDVLQQILQNENDIDCTVINLDDPAQASPIALAQAAAESEAIITANLTRADCGQFLHPQIPLISWLTTRPIPAFDPSCQGDALLLTNEAALQLAKKSGWPADRLFLLPWPAIASSTSADAIAIIADTRPIDPSPAFDLSSRQLLWDLIRAELGTPTKINDIQAYLHSRMKRLNISDHGVDQRRFIEELIVPAYQQSLAAELLKAKIPLRIFGQGWNDIPEFAPHAAGVITSREQLKQALLDSAALLHLWPIDNFHPIDTAGPPVIRLNSRGLPGLIADARFALQGKLIKPSAPAADAFDIAGLARILRAAHR